MHLAFSYIGLFYTFSHYVLSAQCPSRIKIVGGWLKSSAVALTRECDTNDKLNVLLPTIDCVKLPCVRFQPFPLQSSFVKGMSKCDNVMITSPQAAKVFLRLCSEKILDPTQSPIISVGNGTSEVLKSENIHPVFEPSLSTAECLAKECPTKYGMKVFYPASELADGKLVYNLEKRGFEVTRVNTYTTIPTVFTADEIKQARSCNIVTFASPSAVRTWVSQVGNKAIAVAFGPTTEKAARSAGFRRVYSPPGGSKGVEEWAAVVREVVAMEDKRLEAPPS